MRTGFTFGLFDLFHVGDLDILRQAADLCDRLVVGAYTDELAVRLWRTPPYVPLAERLDILANIRFVDEVIALSALSSLDIAATVQALPAHVVAVTTGRPGIPTAPELRRILPGVGVVALEQNQHTGSPLLRQALTADWTAVA